ncbi:MAG: hypothetical protein JEZ00_14595 [Anaerolineaceae bacterium]|nr:hypothetical protein [Anaerolineaceae bacterium]
MNQNNLPEIPGSQGFFHQAALRVKLFFRMMQDPRINIFLKALPVASLLYLVFPFDLAPLMPLDDAAIVSLAFYLFVEFSPKEVIDELMQELRNIDNKDPNIKNTVDIIEGIISNKDETETEEEEK